MGEQRRANIMDILASVNKPVTGSHLAKRFDVSRQEIVQDIALLRALGENIIATPQGYVIAGSQEAKPRQVFACQHDNSNLAKELNLIVDNGGTVVDVMVEHPLYGDLRGSLNLKSRYDVKEFVDQLFASKAKPLSFLTQGVHLHTIEAENEKVFKIIEKALAEAGILLPFDR